MAERFPDSEWLFPSRLRRGAKRGAFHIDPGTVTLVVVRYVRRAEIRTAEGKLTLDIYPHLFRHNVGTSMVNDNIPLMVIQEVLDHGSIEMTPATPACATRRSGKQSSAGTSGSTSAASGSRSRSTGRWSRRRG
ncbi:MAG: tyrosine-type recombinase/integrase [Solirubrobacteraceae bacterium]